MSLRNRKPPRFYPNKVIVQTLGQKQHEYK